MSYLSFEAKVMGPTSRIALEELTTGVITLARTRTATGLVIRPTGFQAKPEPKTTTH
jgi:hypothetical protein